MSNLTGYVMLMVTDSESIVRLFGKKIYLMLGYNNFYTAA